MFSRKKEQQAKPVYNSEQAEALKNLSSAIISPGASGSLPSVRYGTFIPLSGSYE